MTVISLCLFLTGPGVGLQVVFVAFPGNTVKPVLSDHSEIDKTKVLKTNIFDLH